MSQLVGPWPCEECGQLSQYAEVSRRMNRIFCRNPACDYNRTVHMQKRRILEPDGTLWEYDGAGNKRRITMQ